jgi:hypothetical protein
VDGEVDYIQRRRRRAVGDDATTVSFVHAVMCLFPCEISEWGRVRERRR